MNIEFIAEMIRFLDVADGMGSNNLIIALGLGWFRRSWRKHHA